MIILELGDSRYEVRTYLGERQIHVEGVWLNAQQFADYLIDQNKQDEMQQIVLQGMKNTANQN